MAKRIAIVGTAPSWQLAPFQDPNVSVWSLNDAYRMKGFARADRWYDLHPMNKFWFAPEQNGKPAVVYAHQIPIDQYVRPAGHLDWLATQPFPKYLHPEFASQLPIAETWPNVHAFPKAQIEAHFGRYFTSSPGWMLAHAVLEGIRDIEIYGIHLSTEHEYIDQRPNFEFLIGCVLGSGKRQITLADGKRIYETAHGRIVLPDASPVLAANFQYAFEPSPRRQLDPLRWESHKAQMKLARRIDALRSVKPYWPFATYVDPEGGSPKPRTVSLSTLQTEIAYYEALAADCAEQLARAGA